LYQSSGISRIVNPASSIRLSITFHCRVFNSISVSPRHHLDTELLLTPSFSAKSINLRLFLFSTVSSTEGQTCLLLFVKGDGIVCLVAGMQLSLIISTINDEDFSSARQALMKNLDIQ